MSVYGLGVRRHGGQPRDVIAAPERTPAGNIVLRGGVENVGNGANGWHQSHHPVLVPAEVTELIEELAALLPAHERDRIAIDR